MRRIAATVLAQIAGGFLAVAGLAVAGLAVTGHPAQARDGAQPAELPPAAYRGQQYVDSKGCLFMRAGQDGKTVWVPRVTRDGVPLCGNRPSGQRVPVEGEAAAAVTVAPDAAPAAAGGAVSGGYMVAVGSFGVQANAEKAAARLTALGYAVARGRLQGGSKALITVFAGPFDSAAAASSARAALRGAGFPDAVVIAP